MNPIALAVRIACRDWPLRRTERLFISDRYHQPSYRSRLSRCSRFAEQHQLGRIRMIDR